LLGLRAVDRTLCVVPLSRAHGSETLALPTLLAGGTLFLKSPKYRSTGSRSCTRSAWIVTTARGWTTTPCRSLDSRPVGNGCVRTTSRVRIWRIS